MSRADLPLSAYLDARHDRVHEEAPGRGRPARTVRRPSVWRCPRCGAADWSECVCPPHEEGA